MIMKAFLIHILLLLAVVFIPSTANAGEMVQGGKVSVGVMLPLHDVNGDGKRMVEYYRGVLMACDSLRLMGISVDVHAWNVPE